MEMDTSGLHRTLVGFFILVQISASPTMDENTKLILMSLDGFRWDYFHRQIRMPNLRYVAENGVIARKGMKSTFITKTISNHWTLLTGLHAESHGMVGNDFYDPILDASYHSRNLTHPDQAWYEYTGEPIWITNQVQNPKYGSGVVSWPDYTPEVKGVRSFHLGDDDYKKRNLRLNIDLLVEWLTAFSPVNLGIIWKGEPDHTGHYHGPFSPELDAKLEELDEDVGYLLQKLKVKDLLTSVNIIITSDHGMTSLLNKIDLDQYIDSNTYIMYTDSPVADIHPKSKELEDEIYKNLSNVPHLTVYRRDEIPAEYHYSKNRRIAPILAVADLHYWLSHNGSKGIAGNHGYNNSLPSMHPLFIAMGPAFKKNASVETFNNVDVYPLMCHILKLKPAPNNGTMDIVKHLLAESVDENSSSTIFIYILIFVIVGFVAGVFVLVAWQICKTNKYKARQLPVEFSRKVQFTKLDNVPLMDDQSDDEVQCAP